jgi:dTDP-4-dehydrorhamnose reductase
MKVLLIGNTGQLGYDLERALIPKANVISSDYPQIDLSNAKSIVQVIQAVKPEVIINAAAYTAVDLAEREKELAQKVNGTAPGIIAREARDLGALLVHYSTDFVFDGTKGSAYQESDQPNPINVYGETKLAGEESIRQMGGEYFVFRTSWLYSTRQDCFLTKVLDWARRYKVVRVVTDQIGSPTWSRTLAETTVEWLFLIWRKESSWRLKKTGVYHLAGNGEVSRFDWAKRILSLDPNHHEQIIETLCPAVSSEYSSLARRPEYSALDCSSFQAEFGLFKSSWIDSLQKAMLSIERRE